MGSLALRACALTLLFASSLAKVWHVTNGTDSIKGYCSPTGKCNLRGAWEGARDQSGDVILISVDCKLNTVLYKSELKGSITIVGQLGGDAFKPVSVSAEGNGNAAIHITGYELHPDVFLSIHNVNFNDFVYTCSTGTCAGGALRISKKGPGNEDEMEEQNRKRADGSIVRSDGPLPPPANVNVLLRLSKVEFNRCGVRNPEHFGWGGAVAVSGCMNNCLVEIYGAVFHNCSLYRTVGAAGSALYINSGSLKCHDCYFKGNYMTEVALPATGGVVYVKGGEAQFKGGGFGRNRGAGPGVAVTTQPDILGDAGNLYLTDLHLKNNYDLKPYIRGDALLRAQHFHAENTIFENTDSQLLLTTGFADQYFANCSISGGGILKGFAYYIRNIRGDPKILAGAGPGQFANCTEGRKWLGCEKDFKCMNKMNGTGVIVGYDCVKN